MSAATTATIEEASRPAGHEDQGNVNAEGVSQSQIVSFRLANEEYGVDIMRVQEIILMGKVTRVPEVPEFICGLINLRGHVIPIVDLRMRFGLDASTESEDTRIVVLNVGSRTIGIVVDAVNEVLRIQPDQVEPPPSSIAGVDQEYIRGLVKFESKLLILLDIENILSRDDDTALASEAVLGA